MQMTEGEIRANYRQAKNPNDQIKILAELNGVSVERIEQILGEDYKPVDVKKTFRNIAISESLFREVNEFCKERNISKSRFSDEAVAREMKRIKDAEEGKQDMGLEGMKKMLETKMEELNGQIKEMEERYAKTTHAYQLICELEGEIA